MATGPIETHLHRSFKWENDTTGVRGGRGGVRLAAGRDYLLSVFGWDRKSTTNGVHDIENPATGIALDFKASNLPSVERPGYAMSLQA